MVPIDVVVLGSYMQDHAWRTKELPRAGETRIGSFSLAPGGKGFNQAVACHMQGAKTCFLGAIGRDPLGDIAQRTARDFALAAQWELHDTTTTGAAGIVVDAQGSNMICVGLGANAAMSTDFVHSHGQLIADAKILVCQLENNLDATRVALEIARANSTLTLLNPAPINEGTSRALLALADILTPNETEFAFLLKHVYGMDVAPNYWDLPDPMLHQLCRATEVPTVVLTLGDKGCFVSHIDAKRRKDIDAHYRIGPEAVKPLDTVGAGDAFTGGLAAGMIHYHYSQPFRRAVEHANRVAGLSTEKPGAAPSMPSRDDVRARFDAPASA